MGNGNSGNIQRLLAGANAFNDSGDFAEILALMADDIVWSGVGDNKAAVAAALEQAKGMGWVRHDITSTATEGPLIAVTARNSFRDGSTSSVAGTYAFNTAGLISHIASIDTAAL